MFNFAEVRSGVSDSSSLPVDANNLRSSRWDLQVNTYSIHSPKLRGYNMPIDIVTQHTSIPVKIGVEKMKNEERNLF